VKNTVGTEAQTRTLKMLANATALKQGKFQQSQL
jgi:hypothetical protein